MLGQRARAAQPDLVDVSAVLVDAEVELGMYGAAERELQSMVDRKPNLAAYARVSYFRELHGDLAGAVDAMRLAVAAGGPALENVAYVSALLGELERQLGHPRASRRAFERSLARVPGYPRPPSRAWLGLNGNTARSIERRRRIVEKLPLPEYVIGLGEAELAAGPCGRRPARPRARRRRGEAAARRGREHRRRARDLRGRPWLDRARRRAGPPRLGRARRASAPPTRSAGR